MVANYFFYCTTAFVIIYIIYLIMKAPKSEKKRILVALILICMSLSFFILYFQLYESIVLFINRTVNKNLFGISIPTTVFLGVNGAAVIIFSPILSSIYKKLEKKKKDLSITTKFPLGIFLISICFFMLALSTYTSQNMSKISCLWIIAAIVIYSIGELLTSALGVAMVTRIVPKRMYGFMMGAWFLIGNAFAANLSGNLADIANIPHSLLHNIPAELHIYGTAFWIMGGIGLISAIIGFIISPWLKATAEL